MTDIIFISSTKLLPRDARFANVQTEGEARRVAAEGERIFCLTHTYPKVYREYYVEKRTAEEGE